MKYRYLLSCLAIMAGCTSGFERFNTNPNEATEEQIDWDNARTGANFLQMEQNVLVVAQPGAGIGTDRYQTVEMMGGDAFVGYWGFPAPDINSCTRYSWSKASWYGDMFTTNYSRTMNAWRMLKLAIGDDSDPRFALAQILKVAAMHRVTDTYGPIPYLDFGVGDEVRYDSQKDVYYRFFEELSSAVEVLYPYAAGGQTLFADYDCVYRGDISKWVKFANTLRLRLAMHIAYSDPVKARVEAEAAASDPGGMMVRADEFARLQHITPIDNYESPVYIVAGWGDLRLGATLQSYMTGYNDPRLKAWFHECTSGGYQGIRAGMANTILKNSYAPEEGYVTSCKFSIPVTGSTADVVWMRASETYFLLAEAALRGWDVGGTAASFYEEGVKMSFSENNVGGAEEYLLDRVSTPADYTDPVTSSYSKNAMGDITISWDDAADDETKLERIITQKYIALFPVGQEAWTEFRRTGYPKVFPVCVNESNGGCVDDNLQIRRLAFPESEYNTNYAELQNGIALLGGPDNPGTRLWWDAR
ncbi:MAG: SusD/RagB family nutrient-binding outer membrane lipoprotein [Bacteroidales bacterium]|nr:SusD/RagB family nutrient-binding outer membrane lipoprotein [Bacteroidales bacterium]